MEARNCKKCGKIFNYIGGIPICPACKDKAEEQYQTVKKFVQDHKQASMKEIVEQCGVEQKQVQQWIREERLFFTDDSPVKIACELCGATISTGRYCEKCKKETAHTFSGATRSVAPAQTFPEAPKKSASKMYTFRK